MSNQSASRLEGDRYQHLYSWWLLLDLLNPNSRIDHVWVEHPQAGAADDVTVHPQDQSSGTAKYYQIKWHVDHRSGYSMALLIERGDGDTSLLEKMWRSWNQLKNTDEIEIWLVSNWAAQPGDPLGTLIHGREHRLKDDLITASSRSNLGQWRQRWQAHLGADDEAFAEFYRSLRLRLGFASIADLEEMVDDRMQANGLKSGEGSRGAAIDQVRAWIEEGGTRKKITLEALEDAIVRLDLRADAAVREDTVVIALHTWSVRKYDLTPDYELDWSAHFDHQSRRTPEPETWNNVLIPELRNLEKAVSQLTACRYIRLRGSLCLSAAFAVGHVFSVAGGYMIEVQHRNQLWRSDTPPDPEGHIAVIEEPGTDTAADLLVVLSITGDAKPQVVEYTRLRGIAFQASLNISLQDGSHDYGVRGAAHASVVARETRLVLRRAVDKFHPKITHLFYFGPQSLAVFIGQKINACGLIQLYEYQNPGYKPSCLIQ